MRIESGHMTRSYWRRALIAATLTVGVVVSLAACSSTAKTSKSSNGGGTLTVALPLMPQSLSPGQDGNGSQNIAQYLAYEPLIWANTDGTFMPGLATSWKYVGEGNKQFQMDIRTTAKFADGTPVTAEAVAATINYYLKHPAALSHYLTGITAATATGNTVSVTLSSPNPILPLVFSQSDNWGDIISPAGLASPAQLTKRTFGAGAYTLDTGATVIGDHYTYTKNPNYWNPARQHYSKVVVKVITDPNSALQALQSGQIDVDLNGTANLANQAKGGGLAVTTGNPFIISVFLLDRAGATTPALGNVKVRQALNYAIDRSSIAKALGAGFSPSEQFVPPGLDGYDASLDNTYPYDPAKAKQLLADAGYPNGFSFKLCDTTLQSIDTATQAVIQQLAAVGVKVTLTADGVDLNKLITDMATKTFGAVSFLTGGPTFANSLQNFAAPTSPLNPFKSTDPDITKAFNNFAAAPPSQQKTTALALNKVLVDKAWFVPVVSGTLFVFSKGVKNFGPLGTNGELNVLDWS